MEPSIGLYAGEIKEREALEMLGTTFVYESAGQFSWHPLPNGTSTVKHAWSSLDGSFLEREKGSPRMIKQAMIPVQEDMPF